MQIVTHNGKYHADEVSACLVLRKIWPEAEILRTRDPVKIKPCYGRIVVDVGGVYDEVLDLYDHHQREGVVDENGRQYSSFGLVWKHYGISYVTNLALEKGFNLNAKEISIAHRRFDDFFVRHVDAVDCGVGGYSSISFNANIASLNTSHRGDEGFSVAMIIASAFIESAVLTSIESVAMGNHIRWMLEKREHREILILERPSPWKDVLATNNEVKFVVLPNDYGQWMVQAISEPWEAGTPGVQKNRCNLRDEWGGLESEALRLISGVETAIFCHRGLFIGAAETKADAVKMAQLSLG